MEVGREALRRLIVWGVIAVCGALQLAGQQPHSHPPLVDLLLPKSHARPAPANPPHNPEIIYDASNLGSPLLLDKGWRVGITADPKAADPEFDDSTWAVRDALESFDEVPDEDQPAGASAWNSNTPHPKNHQRPFVWLRLHVKLAPNHGPILLLIELPGTLNTSLDPSAHALGLDVFANGKPIQPQGPNSDAPGMYEQITRIYSMNLAPEETSLTLVVRTTYDSFGQAAYTHFFANRKMRLGYSDDLTRTLELWSIHCFMERLPRLVNSILLTVLALFLLTLYFTQKGHIEYLWLALYELIQAPIAFVELAGSSARLDAFWYGSLMFQLLVAAAYLYFEFLISFLSLRKRWYILLLRFSVPILAVSGASLLLAPRSNVLGLFLVGLCGMVWIFGWLIFIFATLITATLRRNFEAGLLLIPLVLTLVGWVEPLLMGGMQATWGGPKYRPLTLQAGPIPIHFASFGDFTGILVIVLIIFVRFLRVQREQERTSSELAAARSVQELMIPQEKMVTPGFEVETIYNPANEVGGDFYHVHPTPDGGMLVVIGDVAGKGLKAAMNVSMLMGALRSTPERGPAKILAALNRVLVGDDSFTTCQAAWFGADGELVLANAGHLPPYLNSQEVMLPGGLPLGVLADVSYEEVHLYLHPGDRILLMSDGVVEARQPSGELFGFDRVHNLSNQTAFYIADAAKDFGQEDDITVLTVRRLER
jgi:hypothetical protein